MKIALFGATGMIGQRVLREAVTRHHPVTAIARNISKLKETGPLITPAQGNVLDPQQVAGLVAGHDAVVSAFASSADQGIDSMVNSVRSLIAGLTQAGVKRLIVVGGAGSLEVAPGVQLVDTPEFPAEWKNYALAHRDALHVLKTEAGGLEWSYFSPAAYIEPGVRTGTFRLSTTNVITDRKGASRISAEDYAAALVDELEKPRYVRQQFTVGY